MSDIKLLKTTNHKILKKPFFDRAFMQEIIEKNTKELLGLEWIASNIQITDQEHEIAETLCYDEDYCLVVVEYRSGKFGQTVQKGLVLIDYIEKNPAKIRALLAEHVGRELAKTIVIRPRLISIGDDFNEYDSYAIKQLPVEIDLIRFQRFENNLIALEKNFQSLKYVRGKFRAQFDETTKKHIDQIGRFAMDLGDEVVEKEMDQYIAFRKIQNFAYILYDQGLQVQTKHGTMYKTTKVQSAKDIQKVFDRLEQAYDER